MPLRGFSGAVSCDGASPDAQLREVLPAAWDAGCGVDG